MPYQSANPEVASVLATLEKQHRLLYELTTDSADKITVIQVRKLATLLYDHVRFEERELYPIAGTYLTAEERDGTYKASPHPTKYIDEQR